MMSLLLSLLSLLSLLLLLRDEQRLRHMLSPPFLHPLLPLLPLLLLLLLPLLPLKPLQLLLKPLPLQPLLLLLLALPAVAQLRVLCTGGCAAVPTGMELVTHHGSALSSQGLWAQAAGDFHRLTTLGQACESPMHP